MGSIAFVLFLALISPKHNAFEYFDYPNFLKKRMSIFYVPNHKAFYF